MAVNRRENELRKHARVRLEAVVMASPANAALWVKRATNTAVTNSMTSTSISSRVVSHRLQTSRGHCALVLSSNRDSDVLEKASCATTKRVFQRER